MNNDIFEYKGMYFNDDNDDNNENKLKFYEGGAHFKYIDLYNILKQLENSLPQQIEGDNRKKIKSEEKIRKIYINNYNNINDEIISRNNNNVYYSNAKPLIENLSKNLK